MKSPSLIDVILFSWISNFFKLSIVCRAPVGTRLNSLPPMFNRFSFLWIDLNYINKWNAIDKKLLWNYFSVPANALASMFVSLFSYNVNISSVLIPSKAFAWIALILLWFKLNISNRSRLFNAGVGTLLNEFWDRSNWVSAFPFRHK